MLQKPQVQLEDEITVRTLVQKLGLRGSRKKEPRVAVLNFVDRGFMEEIGHDTCLAEDTVYDFILFHAETVERLSSIRLVKKSLSQSGALWIVYPKGVSAITQRQVMFFGNADGFTDVKVCSFSETETGRKFMRRKEHRS